VERTLRSRSAVILVAAVVTAAVSASAIFVLGGLNAVLDVVAWSGAFVAFIFFGTGWVKAGGITVGVVVLAIALAQLIGN